MIYQIEIQDIEKNNPFVKNLKEILKYLGEKNVDVEYFTGYILEGEITFEEVERITSCIFSCPVSQEYRIYRFPYFEEEREDFFSVRIFYTPLTTDPQEESIKRAIKDLGINKEVVVKTFKKYVFKGCMKKSVKDILLKRFLYNPLIEYILTPERAKKIASFRIFKDAYYDFKLIEVPLQKMDKKELVEFSIKNKLYLTLDEIEAIRDYFVKKNRFPTDCELETIAQTWSEHCFHKTFKSPIEYTEYSSQGKKVEKIESLFKDFIFKPTYSLNLDWCVSVFKDNAGIIKFDDNFNICFKVETHNHPSSLEPYGGASTGIGGVIRDILGAGKGARPLCNTDVFCFPLPDFPLEEVPSSILLPSVLIKGVVSGVRDYGNKMGIPTVNGAVFFDNRFLGNPLVYCGCIGILPSKYSFKEIHPQDLIVLIGGKTGRDGIHGATFSSVELADSSFEEASSCVQIGNPIEEKKIQEAIIRARDKNLINALTDCGAGGLSSAVGEITKDYGCQVHLEKVPLKYKGLNYTHIWISESQERMVLIVSEHNLDKLKEICEEEEVELSVIGKVDNDKKLKVFYQGNKVVDLDMEFLHKGPPLRKLKAVWKEKPLSEPSINDEQDFNSILKEIISHPNVASKRWIISQYDHEVQGTSVIKPLMKEQNSPQDASCIRPLFNSYKGVAVSCGINPWYADIDPYWMAACCIDEAIRNLVCIGVSPQRIALLDNFSVAKPTESTLGELVRCCKGCRDFALKFKTPFISGKDSLNNEYKLQDKIIAIPLTLLISGIGIVEDVRKVITSFFKEEGSLIYVVGITKNHLGGGVFYKKYGYLGKNVPCVDAELATKIYEALFEAIRRGLVKSAHDISDGGLGVALSEMCFGTKFGCDVFLSELVCDLEEEYKKNYVLLFSESPSRIIVEIDKKHKKEFEDIFKDLPLGLIGCTNSKSYLKIYGIEGRPVVDINIEVLYEAWNSAFKMFEG